MENAFENADTVVEEVMEDIIAAVVSDSSNIETTVHSVLRDIMEMEFGHQKRTLETDTVSEECRDRRMVAIVDQLVDAMVHLVSEKLSAAPHVQPGDGNAVLRCEEEEEEKEEEEKTATGGDFEVVLDEEAPTEDGAEIDEPPATQAAVSSRGRVRRLAAAAWRGVKRAGRAVICLGC
ncbi:unnamed protein product [Macrosiphum euphorbiae]|uniref:Uncharacterized protein n=1 Tax=Macrosiphum euphorbiae TaxID=13131 RepID=A0AAV0X2N3_9HEMI|nr:unnamed protein product [Macrosiphum euphorbiae]CAI6362495.1 unnamed protein product [Macrosiphum euphorbiae]